MKGRFRRTIAGLCSAIAMATAVFTVGCGGSGNSGNADGESKGGEQTNYDHLLTRENGDLYVRYFKGGNGGEWLYKIADDFEKETGIKVYLQCDDDITSAIPTILKNSHPTKGEPSASILKYLPDVCMTQTIKWQEYVNRNYILNIDEIYDYVYVDEDNKTLKDKLIDGADKFGYMGQTPELAAEGDKHYWVVPWTSPLTGIIYNVKTLKSLGRKWANGYVPATVSELFELVNDLNKAGKTAFAWGGDGTSIGYWNFLFMSLWASYQGYDSSYQNGSEEYGSMLDFYGFRDADGNYDSSKKVFEQAGRKIALQIIQDLIADVDNKTWKNSIKDPVSKTSYEAQSKFAFEEAAMIPSGSWIKNEIAEDVEEGFEYAMMPTPAVDLAYVKSVRDKLSLNDREIHGGLLKDGSFETEGTENPDYAQINNTEIGDVMFIPRNAQRKESAVKFLEYVNKQKYVEHSTRVMGIARPFRYTPSETGEYNEFTKSVFAVYEKQNAVQLIRMSESNIFTYSTVKEWADFNESDILLQLSSKTASSLIKTVALKAEDNWSKWLETAGL